MNKYPFFLGCHVSMNAANKYLIGSVEEAKANDCNTFMFFTGAPQNTRRTEIEKLNIEEFKKLIDEYGFNKEKIIVHGPYVINMANSVKKETHELGIRLLVEELDRLDAIGIKTLVLHPGAAVGAPINDALESLASGLNEVFKQRPNTGVKIALETMSGKGTEIGINFEQLKYVIDRVEQSDKVGVCFDTCHLWDSGYDVKNEFETVLSEFDKVIGIDKILAIHLNDSKNDLNSHKDRHDNIGYGNIGFDSLSKILRNPRLSTVPIVLETPFFEEKSPYKTEINMLVSNQFNDWR